MSRAAALRWAKQAQAETQASRDPAYLERELREVPGWETLPPEVRRQIAKYRPLRVAPHDWLKVEAAARRLLALRLAARQRVGEPVSVRKVNVIGSHLAPYLVWASQHLEHRNLADLTLAVLEGATLDRYTSEAMVGSPRSTVATRRSEIGGALRAAQVGPEGPKLPYRPVRPPYLRANAACHGRLAKNQPTAARRRGMAFILAAGYGAGLDAREMSLVRANDIFSVELPSGERAVLIRVRGERPRTVVVRREYEVLLLYAVSLHRHEGRPRNGLMLGRKPDRRKATAPTLEKLVTADDHRVVIEVPRLRSTRLVAHMSAAVPLGVLLSAAGLQSARTLTDLLPFASVPDEAERVSLLRGQPGMLHGALDAEVAP
jgi:hypothetical protein